MSQKKILFEIAHPKHFYQFEPLIRHFSEQNKVFIICRDKDVVIDLIKNSGIRYSKYGIHGKNLFTKLLFTLIILIDYTKVLFKFKPDIVISRSSPYATILSKIFRFQSIIFPDSEVVPLINKFVAPKSALIISPKHFSIEFGSHHKRVSTFFETAYLNQSFTPDPGVLDELKVKQDDIFFILRFVGWQANHDLHNFGFSDTEKMNLVSSLENRGKVFISSEKKLPAEFQKYLINIHPSKIHHALHYANLYVGDSQSMATESALLGTPALRYNSFVGENDMTNFKVLENDYKLLINFSDFPSVIEYISQIKDFKELKSTWLERRARFIINTKDINQESIDIIEQLLNDIKLPASSNQESKNV